MADEIEKDAGFSVEKVDETQTSKEPSPYDMNGPNVKNVIILTDEDLISPKPVQWVGMGFRCKDCGSFAVLHYMKHCGECGAVVSVQSRAATEYVDNLQEKYNGK